MTLTGVTLALHPSRSAWLYLEMSDHALFKFRKIDKYLLKSLVHGELYFARPARLNDPFDCRVNIITALENAIHRSQPPSRQRLEKLRRMKDFFEKVQTDLKSMGVCSFSLELENALMWSHYADDHSGVCLTYSFPEAFFYEAADYILGIDSVQYGFDCLSDWFLKEAPSTGSFEVFGISLIKKVLTVKSEPWRYEKEVRIIKKSEGVYPIDKKYLRQVCFGLATSEPDVKLIGKLIDQGGYEVTLCKIQRSNESDFGIKTTEI